MIKKYMKYNVKFDDYGFLGNFYLSVIFSFYKIIDNRKSSNDLLKIYNSNIEIIHTFGIGKVIITDKKA